MTILVTGASGHLGEALVRMLEARGDAVRSIDIKTGPCTSAVGSITDRAFVDKQMDGVTGVIHAATLHKPHVATHSRQEFVDVNITGTLNLLEAARENAVSAFIFTSTTSTFGEAMRPAAGAPAVWITEDVTPVPKNIYGITKLAAEDICRLFFKKYNLPCLVLRTSRFFPEEDDSIAIRDGYDDLNAKVNELLHRRVDVEDAAEAHLCALARAEKIGFSRYIISASAPFSKDDMPLLREDAPAAVARYVDYERLYADRGWRMFPSFDRVYVNRKAREELGWKPRYDFDTAIHSLIAGNAPFSDLAAKIGKKGYHDQVFEDGPYPVD
ncbi:MAG: NAD(P)-dependent oxidoreductase [Pseudomonadota bacterium]